MLPAVLPATLPPVPMVPTLAPFRHSSESVKHNIKALATSFALATVTAAVNRSFVLPGGSAAIEPSFPVASVGATARYGLSDRRTARRIKCPGLGSTLASNEGGSTPVTTAAFRGTFFIVGRAVVEGDVRAIDVSGALGNGAL